MFYIPTVTAAWKEPVPGWTISKNGPQGFLMGASKGVVRRLPVAKHLIYDYIPVDIVVNNLIAAAYAVDRDGYSGISLFALECSSTNSFCIALYMFLLQRKRTESIPLYVQYEQSIQVGDRGTKD